MIVVTNRKLCKEDFLVRIEKIAALQPQAIILREKDLKEEEYEPLARACSHICQRAGCTLVLNSFIDTALRLKIPHIQVSMSQYMKREAELSGVLQHVGVSVHSEQETIQLSGKRIHHIIAGHIYATDCKKGIPGRGISFLKRVCQRSSVPVWGIGGIGPENYRQVLEVGAADFCVMSSAMTAESVSDFFMQFS